MSYFNQMALHPSPRPGRKGIVSETDAPAAPEHPSYPMGRVRARFGVVAQPGYQPLPDVLLFHQAELGITSEELNVLLNLLAHWYEPARMPFPRASIVAKRMGVSDRSVHRLLTSLIGKGIIYRTKRGADGVAYDVTPLLLKLQPLAQKRLAALSGLQASAAA